MTKLRVLSLFAGIGGFDLGLERTNGFQTVAFCEIDSFAVRVLNHHWPKVPVYGDVRELTAAKLAADGITAIDVITGGFPCQDVSCAGRQAGITDDTRSGLWSEIVRLTRELRPTYVIVENVANLLAGPSEQPGKWFGRVLGDLAECGYDAEWENIPAAAVGAPHRRERVWIVAYSSEVRRGSILEYAATRRGTSCSTWTPFFVAPHRVAENALVDCLGEPALFDRDDGLPDRLAKLGACGNAVVPQIPELIGRAILASLEEQRAAA